MVDTAVLVHVIGGMSLQVHVLARKSVRILGVTHHQQP